MRPRIGIPCATGGSERGERYSLPVQYVEAVTAAGGFPVLIPCSEAIDAPAAVDMVDGLLLPGGGDVDPIRFGEEPIVGVGSIDPVADAVEIDLYNAFLDARKPVLGICRGCQLMNIAAGGDIYQDIFVQTGTKLQHRQTAPDWHPTHTVRVTPGTLLARIVGAGELRVNSFHHQGVRRVADSLFASAAASDGIVEAVEHRTARFVLGVQWHPERTFRRESRDRAIIEAFVRACAGEAVRRS
mgnify:FL=1